MSYEPYEPAEELRVAIRAISCPTCNAKIGNPCRLRSGEKIIGIHWFRWTAYEREHFKEAAA